MFGTDRELVTKLKMENAHFKKIFNEHNELDNEIANNESHWSDAHVKEAKQKKLLLKIELQKMIEDESIVN